jgi:thiamine pyrophosphate-dependent acetolactate synthase large subunit-like protein
MALGLPNRRVIALDGDGELLMNLCGLPTIMRKNPKKPYSCRRNVEKKYRFTRYVEQTEGISILQARIPGSWKKG